jgi:predicted aspartyl protease
VLWYRKAADQGLDNAQFSLGVMYHNGEGVPQDLAQAGAWYRKAAKQGNADAQKHLKLLTQAQLATFRVPLKRQNGVLRVPVLINDVIPLDFILDSGASDVSIPADVVSTLMRSGTLTAADFTGTNTYTLADGSRVPSQTFRIRSLTVGNWILKDVLGSVGSWNGELLLGQSFLSQFKSWSIDNSGQVLVLSN